MDTHPLVRHRLDRQKTNRDIINATRAAAGLGDPDADEHWLAMLEFAAAAAGEPKWLESNPWWDIKPEGEFIERLSLRLKLK